MKLTYRGVQYDYQPPTIDMVEGDLLGKYRGNAWKARYPRHIPVPQAPMNLKYRGIAYTTHQTTEMVPDTVVAPTAKRPSDPELVARVSKIHQANICDRLERRLEAAKAKGDRDLVRQLERESQATIGSC